jgi:hypothetical protein
MATGEHWGYQRCGRYAYWRVLMHSTNPDHLVPQHTVADGYPDTEIAPRYRKD